MDEATMKKFEAAQHKLQEAESNYAIAESLLIAARRDYQDACREIQELDRQPDHRPPKPLLRSER